MRYKENSEPFHIVIEGNPRTKKNSATLIGPKKNRHSSMLPSKAYRQYEEDVRGFLYLMKIKRELPHYNLAVHLECIYWMKDKKGWPDLIGLEEATADIISDTYKVINHKRVLTDKWLLADDRIIKSWDGSRIAGIDKNHPRVEINIYPLAVDMDTECDPYLIRKINEATQQQLFK